MKVRLFIYVSRAGIGVKYERITNLSRNKLDIF